jgi:hypothetical protein
MGIDPQHMDKIRTPEWQRAEKILTHIGWGSVEPFVTGKSIERSVSDVLLTSNISTYEITSTMRPSFIIQVVVSCGPEGEVSYWAGHRRTPKGKPILTKFDKGYLLKERLFLFFTGWA